MFSVLTPCFYGDNSNIVKSHKRTEFSVILISCLFALTFPALLYGNSELVTLESFSFRSNPASLECGVTLFFSSPPKYSTYRVVRVDGQFQLNLFLLDTETELNGDYRIEDTSLQRLEFHQSGSASTKFSKCVFTLAKRMAYRISEHGSLLEIDFYEMSGENSPNRLSTVGETSIGVGDDRSIPPPWSDNFYKSLTVQEIARHENMRSLHFGKSRIGLEISAGNVGIARYKREVVTGDENNETETISEEEDFTGGGTASLWLARPIKSNAFFRISTDYSINYQPYYNQEFQHRIDSNGLLLFDVSRLTFECMVKYGYKWETLESDYYDEIRYDEMFGKGGVYFKPNSKLTLGLNYNFTRIQYSNDLLVGDELVSGISELESRYPDRDTWEVEDSIELILNRYVAIGLKVSYGETVFDAVELDRDSMFYSGSFMCIFNPFKDIKGSASFGYKTLEYSEQFSANNETSGFIGDVSLGYTFRSLGTMTIRYFRSMQNSFYADQRDYWYNGYGLGLSLFPTARYSVVLNSNWSINDYSDAQQLDIRNQSYTGSILLNVWRGFKFGIQAQYWEQDSDQYVKPYIRLSAGAIVKLQL